MLISVWIWPICWAMSLEPSVISSVTSEYFLARDLALSLMALSQPWSAWGLPKPMVTALPGLSSATGASSAAFSCFEGSLLVQAVSSAPHGNGRGAEQQ